MGKAYVLLVLPLWTIAPGCSLIENATRNLVVDPIHFSPHVSEWTACRRNDKLAEAAWNYIRQINPECEESVHYARGFKQGFADYLAAGGTGAPPPIPPRQYWRTSYQTPRGHQAVEDWYAGFRHGATMAQDSGFRQWITVPSSLTQPAIGDELAEAPTLNGSVLKPAVGSSVAAAKKPRLGPPKKAESSATIASRPPAGAAAPERAVPTIVPVHQENVAPPAGTLDKAAPQGPPISVVSPVPGVIIKGTDSAPQGPPIVPPQRLPVIIKGTDPAPQGPSIVPPQRLPVIVKGTDPTPQGPPLVPPERLPSVVIKGADPAQQGPPIGVVPPERLPSVIIKGADPVPSLPKQPDKQGDGEAGRK
jgi:hypothetical protein